MRKINNIIRNTVLCILTAMLAVSCLLEKDGPSDQMRGVMIQVSVQAEGLTKAEYEDPTSAEKAVNTLRVYAFYGDRLAGYAERGATALGDPFYMDLELPATGVHNVDFYLIANEAEMSYENGLVQLSENMTRTQLEAVKFTSLSSRTALPMYCRELSKPINVEAVSGTANDQVGHEGHFVLADPVSFTLERSLAKLSVYAAKVEGASSTPQIRNISLLAQGTREYSYLFPQTAAVLDGVPHRANNRNIMTTVTDVVKSVARGSSAAQDPANYTEVVAGQYLPEVREGVAYDDPSYRWNVFVGSPADAARSAVLHVEYSLGAGADLRNAYVYLPCIERNHHLKVCILINAEGQILINYVVADWDWDEDRMQNWFFDYPTHTFIRHEIPHTDEDLFEKPASKATMSETQPFTGYFQMTYPTSDRWTPTLEGLNASKCDIKIYNVNDLSVPVYPPLAASEDWYRIDVVPQAGHVYPGETVNLAITYTPGGLVESEYLLINGSYPDYFWPESASENYITITMVN